jgi:ABC-2 type transport system permease protein
MNTQSNALSESFQARRVAPAVMSATRPVYWSVRRELRENRWIYIGQLAIAAVFLLGYLVSLHHLPVMMHSLPANDPAKYRDAVAGPYDAAAGVMMATLILMSLFYSAEALHGERRDRSILFWKSLPVSDRTTVLAKASVLLVVLPLLTFAVTVVMQVIMLLLNSMTLVASGYSVASLWGELGMFQVWGQLFYHLLTAHALWPFPIFCWVMLVSGWARRAVWLWAALPVVAIGAIEKLVFHTAHFIDMTAIRLIGGGAPTDITNGAMMPFGPMTHLTPFKFFGSPDLWIGLLFAALFLAAAVRLRRHQGPI